MQQGRNADAVSQGALVTAQQALSHVDAGVEQMKDDWVQKRLAQENLVRDVCQESS